VNPYLAALSHAFSVAVRKWEWINDKTVAGVRKAKDPEGRIGYLVEPEKL